MPHLLELFCGTGSIGRVFQAKGWSVTSVDLDPKFEPDICCDVLDLEPGMLETRPDLIWASPRARATPSPEPRRRPHGIWTAATNSCRRS